ncbi:MAG TPA: FGGY-family carbohydrate kinase, partial [Clostridium sp.]
FVLWRAVLESIAYDYMEITDAYRNAGIEINRITITEGGSRDNLWNQIKADVMESEAITLETLGGAVLTNCIIAAYATGAIEDLKHALISNLSIINTYSPNSNNSKIYKNQYQLKKDVLKKLSN